MVRRCIVFGMTLFVTCILISCDSRETPAPKPEASAQIQPGPETVLKMFCDLDAGGRRFSIISPAEEKAFYQGLVAWEDEPRWDNAIIISGFSIKRVTKTEDSAEMTVRYFVKGKYAPANISIAEKVEDIVFRAKKMDAGWKISGPIVCPHVYLKSLITKLQDRVKQEPRRAQKRRIQNDIDIVKNMNDLRFKKNTATLF